MKILFSFSGTGCPYDNDKADIERISFNKGVLRVYLHGCWHKQIGNGFLFPDLEIIIQKITAAFSPEPDSNTGEKTNYSFDIGKFNESLGLNKNPGFDSEIRAYYLDPKDGDNLLIESIAVIGYSRGAVTALGTALHLDLLGIPIDIISNQAVSGDLIPAKGLYGKYHDLSQCTNIRSMTQILASHKQADFRSLNDFQHCFMTQMVAIPPANAKQATFLIPHQYHDTVASPASYHIGRVLAEQGYVDTTYEEVDDKYPNNPDFENKLIQWYELEDGHSEKPEQHPRFKRDFHLAHHSGYAFTPVEYRQIIYGANKLIPKDPYYLDYLQQSVKTFILTRKISMNQEIGWEEKQLVSLHALSKIDDPNITQFAEFILSQDEHVEQYKEIVAKTYEICAYLVKRSKVNKFDIREQALAYQKNVYQLTYDFFKSRKTPEEKAQFNQKLYETECQFRENALAQQETWFHLCLKFLTNFIAHITGVGMIANLYNKRVNNNWLLFKHTPEIEMVRDNREAILAELDHSALTK